jgi:glyoxylase-like metal-dependent hydrolase (beta-lactamase superfamily II)
VGPSLSELDAGIVQITMPLPWALDHVHCYAVPDAGGWTLIDCGLGTRSTLGWWEEALAQLDGRPVERVVITHYHPDHIGARRVRALPGRSRHAGRDGRRVGER